MAAVSVRSNDGNPASAGGGRMVRFAGFTAEAPAVGSAAEEGAAGTVAEAAAGGGGGVRRTRGAHELVLTRRGDAHVHGVVACVRVVCGPIVEAEAAAPAAARGHVATPT